MNKTTNTPHGKPIFRQNEDVIRKCPHCKTEVQVKERFCPNCNYSLHWMKSGQNIAVDYVQSPLPKIIAICALIAAIVGQLCIYLLDSSVNDYFLNRLSLPSIQTLHVTGHLLKAIGETTLLYGLLKGLRFEYHNFTWHIAVTIILLLLYHILAAALPEIGNSATLSPYYKSAFTVCFGLLAISGISYFLLGLRINSSYFGLVSTCGLLMIIYSGVHFATSVIFNLSSKEFYSDSAVFVLAIIYFIVLKGRLLTHEEYVEKKVKLREEAM